MDLVIAFIAGGIAFLALAMGIEKAREKKEEDHKAEMPEPLIRVESVGTDSVFARVDIPHERFIQGDVEAAVEGELKRLLINEMWKFVDVRRLENPMNLTTRFEARIRVVKR